jgi:hypothetical protein
VFAHHAAYWPSMPELTQLAEVRLREQLSCLISFKFVAELGLAAINEIKQSINHADANMAQTEMRRLPDRLAADSMVRVYL